MKSEKERFELTFKRPSNYFSLGNIEQWIIDRELGLLDWKGEGLTRTEINRFKKHYTRKNINEK